MLSTYTCLMNLHNLAACGTLFDTQFSPIGGLFFFSLFRVYDALNCDLFIRLQFFLMNAEDKIGLVMLTSCSKGEFIDIDADHKDPQLCRQYAVDIYNNLRVAEVCV